MPRCLGMDCSGREAQDATALNEKAIWYAQEGRLEEAVASLQEVLRLQPNSAGARNNLGNALSLQGKYDEAVACYEWALRLRPHFAEAYSNLGNALASLGRYEEAVRSCHEALLQQPGYASAYHNLGNAYKGLGKLSQAIGSYQQALALDPDLADTRINLGVALVELGRLDDAVAQFRDALRLKPDSAEACSQLGVAFVKQENWDAASVAFRRALDGWPNRAQAYYNLGFALAEQGKRQDAVDCFRKALQFRPDDADTHWSLALSLLALGDFEQGWAEYEWRWRLKGWSNYRLPRPLWEGSSLAGRTILLFAEGGLGDTIQFVRYAPLVKQCGGRVLVGCQESLVPLLASCPGIDGFVAAGSALPPFDVQAQLLSLPWIFKTTLASVPAEIPYLWPYAKLQEKWQRRLRRFPGFRIGIAWQGNPQYHKDRLRSIPLVQFAPLTRLPGVRLFSLQKGTGTEQLDPVSDQFQVIDLGCGVEERTGSFMETAAIMKNLDLVISSDTSVAHLAGALGVPVWVALSHVAEWRWLLEREDSPWYPTMRLFRQSKPGDWEGVFERMAQELSKKVAARHRQSTLTIPVAAGELIDKITILEIKAEKIRDRSKLVHVQAELQALQAVRDRDMDGCKEIARLTSRLKAINQRLWHAEDEIRRCEEAKDFGPRFIKLARSIYRHNDRRCALKRQINELLGSAIVEEKVYG